VAPSLVFPIPADAVSANSNVIVMTTQTIAPISEASALIDDLREKAGQLLGSVFDAPLQSFSVGKLGNFPYVWQNPANLKYSAKTYGWVQAALKAKADPVEQAGVFTNQFIHALGSISFSLSSDDQAKLNKAHSDATEQQAALLQAWQQAFGSIPDTDVPINDIVGTIASDWAKPATTLNAMQQTPNLADLLNNTPPGGQPVLPVLADWLNALGGAISLQNAVSMNQGYLRQALRNVQTATADNGGTTLDDKSVVPSYPIATQTADILNGLKATSNAVSVSASVQRTSSSEFRVQASGGTAFSIPVLDFFSLGLGGNASYFQDQIAIESNTIEIEMTFTGVTPVQFGPADFSAATGKNWYYMEPIADAIKNGDQDVTGFKFSPDPQIDFSASGPFGFLTGLAISNYPSFQITVSGSNYASIEKQFQQSASAKVSFLGIPLGGASESTYSSSVKTNAASQSVTITLDPPKELVAGNAVDSRGWVLGVQTQHPAS